jgi:hypothetical protein
MCLHVFIVCNIIFQNVCLVKILYKTIYRIHACFGKIVYIINSLTKSIIFVQKDKIWPGEPGLKLNSSSLFMNYKGNKSVIQAHYFLFSFMISHFVKGKRVSTGQMHEHDFVRFSLGQNGLSPPFEESRHWPREDTAVNHRINHESVKQSLYES